MIFRFSEWHLSWVGLGHVDTMLLGFCLDVLLHGVSMDWEGRGVMEILYPKIMALSI